MRSAALLACLALLLASGAAQARKLAPRVAELPEGNGYHPVSEAPEVLAEGGLRASVRGGTLRPGRGYTPLEVVLHNSGPVARPVRLTFRATSQGNNRDTSRALEVGPGQSLSTFLLVPAFNASGALRLESPGVESQPVSLYMEGGSRAAVLVLGNQESFEAATAVPRVERESPRFSARFLVARDAPRELAAYVGYDAVVLVEDVTAVPADVWAALEAYAATGGHLVLARPPRDVRERLPLLASFTGELFPYGFGQVRLCGGPAAACGQGLSADLLDVTPPVRPAGPPPRWERGGEALADGQQPLLPNARAPLGRFLAVIVLFTLVVGPGGLVLARRKGPVALLIAVPAVAFVTCATIILNSMLVDGFGVHAARFGYTWLDRERDRALTVGVGAWYANLAPGQVRLPASAALLAPEDSVEQVIDLDWTQGMTVGAGFLRSRTYREWGELAVVPTRARLVVTRQGDAVRVRNALGAPVETGLLWLGGRAYTLPALADGAEGLAVLSVSQPEPADLGNFLRLPGPEERRFSFNKEGVLDGLGEGDFLAKVGGAGFSPLSGALELELHQGVHLVRGRVDGP